MPSIIFYRTKDCSISGDITSDSIGVKAFLRIELFSKVVYGQRQGYLNSHDSGNG